MKMNLKGKKTKLNLHFLPKFNSKNLFIFLVSFSLVSLIIGIFFYSFVSSSDRNSIISVVKNNMIIKNNYNYMQLLKDNILSNTYSIFLVWILGISVIGIIFCIFLYFCELFSIGFTISAIFDVYGMKGILGSLCYLFPSKVCYILLLFLITYFAIKISYKIICLCFYNREINMKYEMHRYFKVLTFIWFFMIGVSLLNVFVDPIFIKIFTKL